MAPERIPQPSRAVPSTGNQQVASRLKERVDAFRLVALEQRTLLAIGHVVDRDDAIMHESQQPAISAQCEGGVRTDRGKLHFTDDAAARHFVNAGARLIRVDESQVTAVFGE